nr:amylo-alpha-1,6-glucosidase [Actinomycetota bacterium]
MSDLVQILEGNTFVVSDSRGDIEASRTDPTGLFSADTRFLSTWVLSVNGERLTALSTDDLQYYEARFFLVPGTGTVYVDAKLSVIRRRVVGAGFTEELSILNHADEPVDLDVRIDAGADFADIFEVKDALRKKGSYHAAAGTHDLVLGYQRESFRRETVITSTEPASYDERGLSFIVRIEPHAQWVTTLTVESRYGTLESLLARPGRRQARQASASMRRGLDKWVGKAPRLDTDSESLQSTYQRSLVDLAALRFEAMTLPGRALPAAGLPWFMTIFGRDSILTSLQSLPFTPELAQTTLLALGERQGTRVDDF